jgi:hypothetical protein
MSIASDNNLRVEVKQVTSKYTIEYSGGKGLIKYDNGKQYEFTVYRGTINVTSQHWGGVVVNVARLFQDSAEKSFSEGEIKEGNILLEGNFADITSQTLREDLANRQIKVLSAKVSYKHNGQVLSKEITDDKFQSGTNNVSLANIYNYTHSFLQQAPRVETPLPSGGPGNTAGPQQAQATPGSQAQQPQNNSGPQAQNNSGIQPRDDTIEVPVEEDPRVAICEGRQTRAVRVRQASTPLAETADYALADQIHHMRAEVRGDFCQSRNAEDNVKEIRQSVYKFIKRKCKDTSTNWLDDHAKGIFNCLRLAEIHDRDTLTRTAKAGILRSKRLSYSELRSILSKDDATKLSAKEKIDLAEFYANYIENDGKILGEVFHKHFVDAHFNKDNYKFQINVILENEQGKQALVYPTGKIDPEKCAFIHCRNPNNDPKFLSYEREGDAQATSSGGAEVNLNDTAQRLNPPRMQRIPVPTERQHTILNDFVNSLHLGTPQCANPAYRTPTYLIPKAEVQSKWVTLKSEFPHAYKALSELIWENTNNNNNFFPNRPSDNQPLSTRQAWIDTQMQDNEYNTINKLSTISREEIHDKMYKPFKPRQQ